MRVSHVLLAALVATLPLAGIATPEHPARTLLAISKVDHTLCVIDPDTLKVIARLPVGPDPHEVVASADGTRAYVSNTGYGLFHEINVLDLEHLKALPSIDTAPLLGPHGLAYVQDKLWFTAQGSQSVARYDPEAGKVDWVMGTGQNTTHMLYVRPDAKALYTTNVDSGTVSLLREVMVEPTVPPTGVLPAGAKPHLDWRQTPVKVGQGAEGLDVSADGRQLWTATPKGVLSIVDLDTAKVHQQDLHMTGAHRLGISPDGKYVIVASVGTGELLVLDAKTRQEVKRLKAGRGAALLMDPVDNRAFISCTPDNKIVIFDFKTLEVASELDVGGRPDGMAWAVRD
ncbi:YncE family protein [Pseudomonas putida]|uniref:YncE family protein n=1 Tax=Pseudomonas putida TaxID=303 RepID=A0A6I6XYQ3_PSEPU|nr:YncE family protein [Pseudomonas putida]QHG65176.1 YncE family protein [Pseudomonas putida]